MDPPPAWAAPSGRRISPRGSGLADVEHHLGYVHDSWDSWDSWDNLDSWRLLTVSN